MPCAQLNTQKVATTTTIATTTASSGKWATWGWGVVPHIPLIKQKQLKRSLTKELDPRMGQELCLVEGGWDSG